MAPEVAERVLAKVGKREITLGDYVMALERLDPLERLRYQTPERRKLLLDEMINVELLAREAERLGLHQEPRTRAAVDQLLRQEMLRRLRAELPAASDIPRSEVQEYYAANRAAFRTPRRRRVAVIATREFSRAKLALAEAVRADPPTWGELVERHSDLEVHKQISSKESTQNAASKPSKKTAIAATTLAGDLGMVAEPSAPRENARVPGPVRAAAFEIPEAGGVFSKVITSGRLHFVVRALAEVPSRQRSLEEAETQVRTRLVQQSLQRAERRLDAQLAKRIEVTVDETKLVDLQLPQELVDLLKERANQAPTPDKSRE